MNLHVVAVREIFYIENYRFVLDTLTVANRSPTPASKINDFLGLFEGIWGGPVPPFPADLGDSGGPAII